MITKERKHVLAAAVFAIALATGTNAFAETKSVYAPPAVWGKLTEITSVVGGPLNITVTVDHDGDTTVFAEVHYFDENNKRQKKQFKGATKIRVGNDSISAVKVRLRGVPFGTACRVSAQ